MVGVKCLGDYKQLNVSLQLSDDNVPVVCLLDELEAQEFVGVPAFVLHSARSGKMFDQRHSVTKRAYFQCVLAKASIFAKGVTSFASNKSQTYYKLLLRSSCAVPDNLTSKEYNVKLAELAGDVVVPEALKHPTRQSRPRIADSDSEVEGGGVAVRAPPALAHVGEGSASDGESTTSSDSSGSSYKTGSDSEVEGIRSRSMYPPEIMGVPVRLENHSGKADRGLRVTCRNPDHIGCKKYKSCRLDLTVFGQQAPVYYLHTWLSESFNLDESTHRKWKPTRTQIREFLASQPAD